MVQPRAAVLEDAPGPRRSGRYRDRNALQGGHGAIFPGVTHVALTVSDLERGRPGTRTSSAARRARRGYGGVHHVDWLLGGQTLVGLHQFPDADGSDPFDERRPGLDHARSHAAAEPNSSSGSRSWASWAFRTAASLTPLRRALLPRIRQHRAGFSPPLGRRPPRRGTDPSSSWRMSRRGGRSPS